MAPTTVASADRRTSTVSPPRCRRRSPPCSPSLLLLFREPRAVAADEPVLATAADRS
ncbi:hypothetical protein [Streptomyces sp. NPDC058572]|uniref:hypothetical protein n=1 Tax=Streptomyces sp. NPDC058572 TaxID=3346546 RepID=UPI00365319A0